MRLALPLAGLLLLAASLSAQTSAAEHVRLGDSLRHALNPAEALQHYRAALALEPGSYEANWKAAREIADVAKQLQGDSTKDRRDSLYAVGRTWAEAAVKLDSMDANGHFALAMVLGRLSRTRGGKERVRFARIIYDEAARAVQIDSMHDGAYHVLGAWNAEVRRLSGFTRFFAKALFGAGFMSKANWADAVKNLERAVALNPQHIYHRLELAEVYADVGQYTKAREQATAIAALPINDVLDHRYKQEAESLLVEIKDKKDKNQS
jgi:tetratricopeptide (TPR) repeat protein